MLGGGWKNLPGWGWRVQGTLRRAGNFRSADYSLENTGLKESNFSAATGYTGQKISTELYFSHFGTNIVIFQCSHLVNPTHLPPRLEHGRHPEDATFPSNIC